MASLKKSQVEAIASIDTAKAMIDKVFTIMDIMVNMPSLSQTLSASPIEFLLQLLEHLNVTYEELKVYLTRFLIFVTPALEIGVKTVLLTNLKNMVSCSVDPRIPDKYRKRHKNVTDRNTPNEYGIDIDIETIDFLDKLSFSPLDDYGRDMYFGTNGLRDIYKFARADDFDAFLWFVMHRGRLPMCNDVSLDLHEFQDGTIGNFEIETLNPSLFTELNVKPINADTTPSKILPGNTFGYKGVTSPNIISMCIDVKYNDKNKIVKNTLVPTSDDLTSINWYARKKDTISNNLFGYYWTNDVVKEYDDNKKKVIGSKTINKPRDYSKERGLCNLQYIDTSYGDQEIVGLANNKFRFTILPKPYIHVPSISDGEPPWRFVKMTFDADGKYNVLGKYTIPLTTEERIDVDENGEKIVRFFVDSTEIAVMGLKSGKVQVTETDNKPNVLRYMFECYPGLTVYEFNYDYVMSIKLFDPKVLATTLLNTLFDIRLGVNLSIAAKNQERTEKIKSIIKTIIHSKDGEVDDCYFSFDNSKYERLLVEAEKKRAEGKSFGRITNSTSAFTAISDALREYDSAASPEGCIEALSRAINVAAVTLSENADEKDEYQIKCTFVLDLIENLVVAIMDAILTPKVLMLLEINRRIMGDDGRTTWDDLLKAMQSIIASLVNEIRDLIIQELLKLLMSQLQPIIELLGDVIFRERLDYYSEVIENIVKNCPSIWFSFGNRYEDTKLDVVDYADIDYSSTASEDELKPKQC